MTLTLADVRGPDVRGHVVDHAAVRRLLDVRVAQRLHPLRVQVTALSVRLSVCLSVSLSLSLSLTHTHSLSLSLSPSLYLCLSLLISVLSLYQVVLRGRAGGSASGVLGAHQLRQVHAAAVRRLRGACHARPSLKLPTQWGEVTSGCGKCSKRSVTLEGKLKVAAQKRKICCICTALNRNLSSIHFCTCLSLSLCVYSFFHLSTKQTRHRSVCVCV